MTKKEELLKYKLWEVKDHSRFLERLLAALYGKGWQNLTIAAAKEWHKKQFK